MDRVNQYRNTWSRDGRYIECTEDEYRAIFYSSTAIERYINAQLRENAFEVVELDINDCAQICKVGLTMRAPAGCGRVLFVCVGGDRGLKTWYITPGRKRIKPTDAPFPPLPVAIQKDRQR